MDLRVTDADGCSKVQRYTLTVDCPPITITPSTLTNAARNTPYSTQLIASGGTPGYRFNIQSGSLPTGLTLTTGGLLSGTITAAPGSYSFTVRALDLNDCPGKQLFTLTVTCPSMSITPSTLSSATVGSAYSQALSASGGTAPYVWSVISGALPNGLSLSTNGILSGTPTQATTATFTIEARDAFNCAVTQLYSLVVTPKASIPKPSFSEWCSCFCVCKSDFIQRIAVFSRVQPIYLTSSPSWSIDGLVDDSINRATCFDSPKEIQDASLAR